MAEGHIVTKQEWLIGKGLPLNSYERLLMEFPSSEEVVITEDRISSFGHYYSVKRGNPLHNYYPLTHTFECMRSLSITQGQTLDHLILWIYTFSDTFQRDVGQVDVSPTAKRRLVEVLLEYGDQRDEFLDQLMKYLRSVDRSLGYDIYKPIHGIRYPAEVAA